MCVNNLPKVVTCRTRDADNCEGLTTLAVATGQNQDKGTLIMSNCLLLIVVTGLIK